MESRGRFAKTVEAVCEVSPHSLLFFLQETLAADFRGCHTCSSQVHVFETSRNGLRVSAPDIHAVSKGIQMRKDDRLGHLLLA